jgi:hypothetical protein
MIQDKLIRSDELPSDPVPLERALGGTCIMLSTLSMLSNPALDVKGVFKAVPVVQLVIDEASQINLYDFMVKTTLDISSFHELIYFYQPLFEQNNKDLRKVCFFGDPQQRMAHSSCLSDAR